MRKLLSTVLMMLACLATDGAWARDATRPVVVAYVFAHGAPLDPTVVDATRVTHVHHAFSRIVDGRLVEGDADDAESFRRLAALRDAHPGLHILTSVGGWTWSDAFSEMAANAESRRRFVESAVAFSRRHALDGIDIDWEYPGLPGAGNPHTPDDGRNFTLLLRELRTALDALGAETGRRQSLAIASGGFPDYLARSEIGAWQASLDYVAIMAYDFHVPPGTGRTAHHAALHAPPDALSASRAVRDHIAAGVPASKLVLGVPFYGRAWGAVDNLDDAGGLERPAGATQTPFAEATYATLVDTVIGQPGWQVHRDAQAGVPWLWHPQTSTFVSYEDAASARGKAAYARHAGLAGVMFWHAGGDHDGALVRALVEGFQGTD
ncbi:MAG: glycoside hydrolase family 18 protein [Luteimonas sp.]